MILFAVRTYAKLAYFVSTVIDNDVVYSRLMTIFLGKLLLCISNE